MESKVRIAVEELALQPFTAFEPDGVVLVSGSGVEHANPMTISWGMFGIMWKRPVMMVMVRPTRHTWSFINSCADFTVNWLAEEHYEALNICGNRSGRDINKFEASGLHPQAASVTAAPVIAESTLSLECRLLYKDNLLPERFVSPKLQQLYTAGDYHGLFFGEIVAATGLAQFRRTLGQI